MLIHPLLFSKTKLARLLHIRANTDFKILFKTKIQMDIWYSADHADETQNDV